MTTSSLDEAQRGTKELNKHEHISFYGNCGLGLFGEEKFKKNKT